MKVKLKKVLEMAWTEYIKVRVITLIKEVLMNRKEAFRRWLQNEKVVKTGKSIPGKTIESYIKGISHLSDTMYENGVIEKRLYSMREKSEVEGAISVIKKSHIYINMNNESGNVLHKALNEYVKFSCNQ